MADCAVANRPTCCDHVIATYKLTDDGRPHGKQNVRPNCRARLARPCGNVFADIGLPNAAAHSIKADLVLRIAARIKSKGLTQAKAAALLGLAQPDVSKLLRGHFAGYTYDRLFGYLNALGEKVSIEVSEAKNKKEARLELEMMD